MMNGGIGDFLYIVQALKYASLNYDYVDFSVVARSFFHELAEHFLGGHVSKVYKDTDKLPGGKKVWSPRPMMPDWMGFHPAEVAFQYYCNHRVPEGWWGLPEIKGDEAPVEYSLPDKYVVICAGGTTPNRTLPPHIVDALSQYLIDKQITPVYLGKSAMHDNYKTIFPDANYSLGIDLRDKTGLMQAACIMANAKLVIGLDGGLMHLASCSKVPTLWGMTVASWESRKPHRDAWSEHVVASNVDCLHCQEKYRYMYMHDFRNCLQKHLRCVINLKATDFINRAEEIL